MLSICQVAGLPYEWTESGINKHGEPWSCVYVCFILVRPHALMMVLFKSKTSEQFKAVRVIWKQHWCENFWMHGFKTRRCSFIDEWKSHFDHAIEPHLLQSCMFVLLFLKLCKSFLHCKGHNWGVMYQPTNDYQGVLWSTYPMYKRLIACRLVVMDHYAYYLCL